MILSLPYAGSRRLLRPKILPVVLEQAESATQYREPFVGGGSIGLMLMSRRPDLRPWLNDIDKTVAAYWWCVRHRPERLIARVRAFEPIVRNYLLASAYVEATVRLPQAEDQLVEAGFARLVTQYMSARSWGGGVRGGLQQLGKELCDSRWNPETIARSIQLGHARLSRVGARITAYDFAHLIDDVTESAVLYLDPPFLGYEKNYIHGVDEVGHERLADLLGATQHRWVLSMGDHPTIRRLYQWARQDYIGYNNLLIYPKRPRKGKSKNRFGSPAPDPSNPARHVS